jgi:hypothetical protein
MGAGCENFNVELRIRLGQRGQSNVGAKSAEDPHPSPPLFEPEPQSRRPEYQGRGKEQNNGHMRLPCRLAALVANLLVSKVFLGSNTNSWRTFHPDLSTETHLMFARISYTWEIMGAAWSVLKRDKALVLFPLCSSFACFLVIASFIVPFFMVDLSGLREAHGHFSQAQQIAGWAYLFAFYFVNYFVITFFNVGIVSCAVARMAGAEPTFGTGMRAALQRIHLIAGWALVSATVGLILKIIESYSKKFGRIVAGILGLAWSIMTFLVVPVLVVENKGPFDALKESMTLLKKTWGTQVVGNFSFGLIFFFLFLPALFAIFFSVYLMAGVSATLGLLVLGMAIVYIVGLALIQSALHSIFQAALYMYTQGVPDETRAFPVQLLRGAMYDNA